MSSKKKTGGGPYEEMLLTSAEEQIVQAAGIGATVEGLSSTKTFGALKEIDEPNTKAVECLLAETIDDSDNDNIELEVFEVLENKTESKVVENKATIRNKQITKSDSKLDLLRSNLEKFEDSQNTLNTKLDRLLQLLEKSNELKEKIFKLKEEEHTANLAVKKVDLEIKTLELEMLKQRF